MSAPRKHLIANQKAEALIGAAVLLLGGILLRDAYDNRGKATPRLLRPFTFL